MASDGWMRGSAPKEHTTAEDRKFHVHDPVKLRPYLQCLVGLGQLVSAGDTSCLRPDQRLSYYKCVASHGQLAGVPLDAEEKTYVALLKDIGQSG